MPKLRVLHLLGIDDSDTVQLTHLGPGAEVRYACQGNVDLVPVIDLDRVELVDLVCGAMSSDTVRTPRVDVALNSICDADSSTKALARVARIVDQLGLPVVNHPAQVAATTRDGVASRLAGIDGLVVPATVRVTPRRAADVVPDATAAGVEPPFLLREVGSHGGRGLALVGGSDTDALDRFAFDRRSYYATSFVDFRSPDGWYRKHRVLLVGGGVHRRHRLVAPSWNVHASERAAMAERPEHLAEESAWIVGDPPLDLAPFSAIHERLGLDVVGVDFGIDGDGRVLLFEANPCFRMVAPGGSPAASPMLPTIVAGIRRSLTDLLVARGAERAPA